MKGWRKTKPSSRIKKYSDPRPSHRPAALQWRLFLTWLGPDGRRLSARHNFSTEKAAIKAEKEALGRLENHLSPFPEEETAALTVSDVLGIYDAEHVKKPETKPLSRQRMEIHKKKLEASCIAGTAAPSLSKFDLFRFQRERTDQPRCSVVTAKKDLSHLRAAMTYAKERGRISGSVFDRLTESDREKLLPPDPPTKGQYLSDEKLEAIIAGFSDTLARAARLARCTGMRKGQVSALRWDEHVRDREGVIVPLRQKGAKKDRRIGITDEVRALIGDRPEDGGLVFRPERGSKSIYSAFTSAWNRARVKAGAPDARPHDMRHSYVTEMVQGSGLSETALSMAMSPKMAESYGSHLKVERSAAAERAASEARAKNNSCSKSATVLPFSAGQEG